MSDFIHNTEARVNVTYGGQNGDLPDTVHMQSSDSDIRAWVTEAVRAGTIPGIRAHRHANFRDFVVDRFSATNARPYNLIQLRPKTPFGSRGRAIARPKGDKRPEMAGRSGRKKARGVAEGNRGAKRPDIQG
jgi:hypothetical protein